MTNAKPEKISIEFETASQGWDSHTISNKHYMDGYNQSHDEWTAYVTELLKPLEEAYRKMNTLTVSPSGVVISLELWNAIKTVIESWKEQKNA